jgi:hypothetical protein
VRVITRHSVAARTIAHATRWVKDTFIPRSFSSALSALRLASSVSTASVRKEVAVGIERLSSIAFASIAAGPRSGVASPSAAGAVGAAAPSPPSAAASTSSFVIRPPIPVPRTVARSIPRSAATRRATGEERPLPVGWADACAVAAGVGSGAAGACAGAPEAEISARASPTWTVSS